MIVRASKRQSVQTLQEGRENQMKKSNVFVVCCLKILRDNKNSKM